MRVVSEGDLLVGVGVGFGGGQGLIVGGVQGEGAGVVGVEVVE